MSQRQEQLRARMWEEDHKYGHEESIRKLQAMKARLDVMDQDSDEYKMLKAKYDSDYQSAEDFFMKFCE